MEEMLSLNSIYFAHEGEGIHIGTSQVFVRFQGCAIGCINCDSIDTWSFEPVIKLNLDETISRIQTMANGCKRVSITGGDPLHPKLSSQVLSLVKNLKEKNYYINIEASGMRIDHRIFDLVDFISFDFKTPSTGVRTPIKNLRSLMTHYPKRFQIKAVIENALDFRATLDAYNQLEDMGDQRGPWCLTPAFNLLEPLPKERIEEVLELNYQSGNIFRVIVQQHKVIHGPDRKQV